MKTRVLYFSGKKKMATFADILCEKLDCKVDRIPPAYPCENEKLVVIGISVGKELPDALRRFCMQINKQRAQNVAFFVDGPATTGVDAMNAIREAGANVVGKAFICKGGAIPFLGKVSEEEKKAIIDWADKIVAEIES